VVRDSRVSDSTKEDSVLILEYIKEVFRHVSACALKVSLDQSKCSRSRVNDPVTDDRVSRTASPGRQTTLDVS